MQGVQENRQLVGNRLLCAGVGVIVGADAQPRRMGGVDILVKVRVNVQSPAAAGADAHNGKLLARRRHLRPVDAALIPRHVNAVLKHSHSKPPFADIVCRRAQDCYYGTKKTPFPQKGNGV